jgi:pimeloyl-ACP methyl ester carboxylesterase
MRLLSWTISATLAAAAASGAQSLQLSPCRFQYVDAQLKCGTLPVRENRDDPRSRTIPLEVIVLPSRAAHPAADPVIFVSPGGPGTTNSEALVPRAWFSWMRDDHDIVIADLRGTSGPSRLDCDMSNAALGAAEYLNTLFPKDKIDVCRDALQRKVDLRSYTTPAIVEDFDEVRRALGYGKVNLWAVSWGTRIEYLWLRMHPENRVGFGQDTLAAFPGDGSRWHRTWN